MARIQILFELEEYSGSTAGRGDEGFASVAKHKSKVAVSCCPIDYLDVFEG